MKKYMAALTGIALLLPSLASAAYNDVSLTTDTIFTVGGIEIDVSGSSATLETISVTDSNTLSIGMQNNSGITIKAPNRNQMTITQPNGVTLTQTCNSSLSKAEIAASTAATVTVTPSSSLCTDSSGGGGGGPVSSGGGGGGGGGGGAIVPVVSNSTTTTTATTSAHARDNTTTTGQLQSRLNALLAQIAALKGGATPNASAYEHANRNASFKRNLGLGSTGDDVKALQIWLNAHGYVIAKSGPGSPGKETTKLGNATKSALKKFQKEVGISPASGYFGAKTRAYIIANQ